MGTEETTNGGERTDTATLDELILSCIRQQVHSSFIRARKGDMRSQAMKIRACLLQVNLEHSEFGNRARKIVLVSV
jgi:hypothetical protein